MLTLKDAVDLYEVIGRLHAVGDLSNLVRCDITRAADVYCYTATPIELEGTAGEPAEWYFRMGHNGQYFFVGQTTAITYMEEKDLASKLITETRNLIDTGHRPANFMSFPLSPNGTLTLLEAIEVHHILYGLRESHSGDPFTYAECELERAGNDWCFTAQPIRASATTIGRWYFRRNQNGYIILSRPPEVKHSALITALMRRSQGVRDFFSRREERVYSSQADFGRILSDEAITFAQKYT